MNDYLAFATDLARHVPSHGVTYSAIVELDDIIVEVEYSMAGRAFPATDISPAEQPQPYIHRCEVWCGDWCALAPFGCLPDHVREAVYDEINYLETIRDE